jgi:hypothetical protein
MRRELFTLAARVSAVLGGDGGAGLAGGGGAENYFPPVRNVVSCFVAGMVIV